MERLVVCEIEVCPQWNDWVYSHCSEKCGTGTKTAKRNCFQSSKNVPSTVCKKLIGGTDYKDKEACFIRPCKMTDWTRGECFKIGVWRALGYKYTRRCLEYKRQCGNEPMIEFRSERTCGRGMESVWNGSG